MTYKEIVDRIKEVVDGHLMLSDFGYGNLSDIKANNEGNESADYPYAFLNPTNHSRSGQAVTYRFNLIVMDMVLDQDYLKIQSECQQYIDDILGNLRFGYTDQIDLTLNVTLTPFKERFQDDVAGMTATLEIVIPQRLSDCYSIVEKYQEIVLARMDRNDTFRPEIEQSPMEFRDIILNINDVWRPDSPNNYFEPIETAKYKIIVEGIVRHDGSDTFPTAPELIFSNDQSQRQVTASTWPTTLAQGETSAFRLEYEYQLEAIAGKYYTITFSNEPPIESQITILEGTTINIYQSSQFPITQLPEVVEEPVVEQAGDWDLIVSLSEPVTGIRAAYDDYPNTHLDFDNVQVDTQNAWVVGRGDEPFDIVTAQNRYGVYVTQPGQFVIETEINMTSTYPSNNPSPPVGLKYVTNAHRTESERNMGGNAYSEINVQNITITDNGNGNYTITSQETLVSEPGLDTRDQYTPEDYYYSYVPGRDWAVQLRIGSDTYTVNSATMKIRLID
jgi:hypothetical protein